MASWLKAAEDLFEVVDRKAKLAVGEKSDELSSSPLPASSNGQVSKTKRARLKAKAKRRMLTGETPQEVQTPSEEKTSDTLQLAVEPDKDTHVLPVENKEISRSNSTVQIRNEEPSSVEKKVSALDTQLSESISVEEVQHDAISEEPQPAILNKETIGTTPTVNHTDKDSSGILDEASTSLLASKGVDAIPQGPPINLDQDIRTDDASTPTKVEEQGPTYNEVSTNSKVDTLSKQADLKVDPVPNENKQDLKASKVDTSSKQADLEVDPVPNVNKRDLKANSSSTKVQEQLDEAQGLLQVAVSTGQSKEARLARVCAGLSTRLQEYKSENAQLEELLTAERELSKSCELRIKQLQKDLFTSKGELAKVESSMAEALAAKNSEIESLVSSMDGLKKQAALSEGNLASLQANMESIIRNRELTETRMMQALREELASAERRAEEERAAHNATKMAAMEREVELEHRAMDTSTALARIQRTADERTAKAAELEQKVALLEVECASLSQELQDMEARARRGQKKSPDEANQVIQIQAWQDEVERARLGQRDAESKLSSVEAELQKMRVEMASMKRDAEHYSRQEHMELEKRYRELTDLLYYKQTQLETMASEKAAAEFQLEKEMKRLQEAQVEAERSRFPRRGSSSWEEDTDIKALEPLPLYHRHMVGASMQLQKAAKLLDSGAVRATRFLWRYPTARIMLLFYLVFVHLFLMYLLHRLQEQADTFSSREVAESMGLANGTLP